MDYILLKSLLVEARGFAPFAFALLLVFILFALTRAGFSSRSFFICMAHYHASVANNRFIGCLVANCFCNY